MEFKIDETGETVSITGSFFEGISEDFCHGNVIRKDEYGGYGEKIDVISSDSWEWLQENKAKDSRLEELKDQAQNLIRESDKFNWNYEREVCDCSILIEQDRSKALEDFEYKLNDIVGGSDIEDGLVYGIYFLEKFIKFFKCKTISFNVAFENAKFSQFVTGFMVEEKDWEESIWFNSDCTPEKGYLKAVNSDNIDIEYPIDLFIDGIREGNFHQLFVLEFYKSFFILLSDEEKARIVDAYIYNQSVNFNDNIFSYISIEGDFDGFEEENRFFNNRMEVYLQERENTN